MKSVKLYMIVSSILWGGPVTGQIPVDAQHPIAQILYSSTPPTHPYGIAWFQAVTLQNNHVANNGYVLVDYIKLIEEDITTGNETVLHVENYNGSGALTLNEGGLFERFPSWYYNGTFAAMTNSNRSGGFLTINVGQQPDKVNHFWGVRQLCTIGKRHKVEIRLIISGDVALQAGMDYWTNLTSTSSSDCKEAFYSNWYSNSNGQYITIKYPNYGQQSMFDRTDYGFYHNGKFYLSKKLVDYVSGSSVALLCDATNWQPALMSHTGEFYEYNTGYNYYSAQYYCFKINPSGNSFWVPHAVLNNLVYPSDAVDNGQGGYNFFTNPQTPVNVNQLNINEDIFLFPNPANNYIYINSSKNILGIQIFNSTGKLMLAKDETNISSIDISYYSTGLYFLKLKTPEGELFTIFIKK